MVASEEGEECVDPPQVLLQVGELDEGAATLRDVALVRALPWGTRSNHTHCREAANINPVIFFHLVPLQLLKSQ